MRFWVLICLLVAACGDDTAVGRPDAASVDAGPPSAIDLLFVVEDSPIEDTQNLAVSLPALVNTLRNSPSGAPDLHIAITTTSMGAGAFSSSIPGCMGTDMGRFVTSVRGNPQDWTACSANHLNTGEHFFIEGPTRNYTGDLATAVGCVVQVGAQGCGFRHPLAAMRAALGDSDQGIVPPDGNAGFLRPNSRLAVIIVAGEDDCSSAPDSLLFDPSQTSLSDPLGPLNNFRCVEFGITCDGLTANSGRIPRTAGGPYQNCRSNDAYATIDPQHSLLPAQLFIDYLRRIKPDVVVAALTTPKDPFVVNVDQQTGYPYLVTNQSCSGVVFGFPTVRLHQVIGSRGPRGMIASECQSSYADSLSQIGNLILAP
jgi:hypothetical protein